MNALRQGWQEVEIPENILDQLNKLLSFEQRVLDTQDASDAPAFEEYEVKFRCADTIHADWCLAQGKAEEDHIRFPVSHAELIKRERVFGEIWGYKAP